MRPPSEPKVNRTLPNKWFIEWNHDVPYPLWDMYPRKRIRIKVYPDINRYKGQEREDYAEQKRLEWKYALEVLKYSPFDEALAKLSEYQENKSTITGEIEERRQTLKKEQELSEEQKRKLTPVSEAFEAFLDSRRKRKLEPETISAYQGLIDWVYEGLEANGNNFMAIGDIRHIHLSEALDYIAEEREWVATTINKGVEFLMTLFNWLETEEYITRNPSKNKFIKLPTYKTRHTWYDRELKERVKKAVLDAGDDKLYRAMEFTYEIMIRSKKEMRKLKIGDIDLQLKRIRFRADLSKTKQEDYRDYNPEFERAVNEMGLSQFPKDYYVFGSNDGAPGPIMCGHNFFSKRFKPIKDKLGLSADFTIYGFKHTRIVHELMKGTDGNHISFLARHNDRKSTNDYMRDYDITLVSKYGPEDLKF